MNILFSCDEYPPAKTGGIGSATKTVAEALASRGHNIYVVSGRLPGHGLPFETVVNGVTIYRITYFEKIAFLLNRQWKINYIHNLFLKFGLLTKYAIGEYARMTAFIDRLIDEKKIDVVEIPDYTILDKYFIERKQIAYHKYTVPCIGRVHGSKSFLTYNKTKIIHPLARKNNVAFFANCDKILAVSKFSADFVNGELGITTKCDVIYNPLDTTFIDQARALDIPRENTIVFLGKIIETKGAFNLLKAFELFSAKHPEYNLVMIGGGFIDKARSLVSELTLQKVVFTGYLKRNEIAKHLKSAAFCIIPSFYENFSMAALEVMGCGNILIYTNAASGPETIQDGVDGFLVNPHDIDEIYDKMLYVADNIGKLASIRNKAIDTVNHRFKETVIIDQLENYYQNCCK